MQPIIHSEISTEEEEKSSVAAAVEEPAVVTQRETVVEETTVSTSEPVVSQLNIADQLAAAIAKRSVAELVKAEEPKPGRLGCLQVPFIFGNSNDVLKSQQHCLAKDVLNLQ